MPLHIPAIVIVAFNRPDSLRRLLGSVTNASYPNKEVTLCICIDHQNSDANQEVRQLANSFVWGFGNKEVICQDTNLGLKKHVLLCGDLVKRFGSIIMLEDDLVVSPGYYTYATQSLNYYEPNSRIGGISLYNHHLNVSSKLPFTPINDGTDVYFLQIASSWGQAWTAKQWVSFRKWLVSNPQIKKDYKLPDFIFGWPDTSWLKHYIYYLLVTDRFFVYPKTSLTTNFGDKGQNNNNANSFFQVPILIGKKDYKFISLDESIARYDPCFDLLPEVLNTLDERLNKYRFCNNLSGLKHSYGPGNQYVLLAATMKESVQSYGMRMKPIELNILHNIEGGQISLVDKTVIETLPKLTVNDRKQHFDYHFGPMEISARIKNLLDKISNRLYR